MAADGVSVAHPRASTVRAPSAPAMPCIAAASKGHKSPASRGHKTARCAVTKGGASRDDHSRTTNQLSNYPTAQLPNYPTNQLANSPTILCRAKPVFVSRRRRVFVSGRQGAAPKAHGKGPSRPCDLGRRRTEGPFQDCASNPPRSRPAFVAARSASHSSRCIILPMGALALRVNHKSLCRGGPPMAADGASRAHSRASTVRALIRACAALHRRRFQRTRKPRFAGTQKRRVAPPQKAGAESWPSFPTVQLFCAGRSPFLCPAAGGF